MNKSGSHVISNNVTWLSKWHNQGSCTSLSEFSLIANPVFVTSASCQHLSCCSVYQLLFSSDGPWRGQHSSETVGPQVCTPCSERQSEISPLFSFLAFCLFSCQTSRPLLLSPNSMIQVFSNLLFPSVNNVDPSWFISQTNSRDGTRHLAPNVAILIPPSPSSIHLSTSDIYPMLTPCQALRNLLGWNMTQDLALKCWWCLFQNPVIPAFIPLPVSTIRCSGACPIPSFLKHSVISSWASYLIYLLFNCFHTLLSG